MSDQLVQGLREPFREIGESGYVYFNFGDISVNPIDAPDYSPAGSMCCNEYAPLQSSVWRQE